MNQNKQENKNAILLYRKRMGFSQKTVSQLLGHKDATLLCSYEHGRILPPLGTALALGIVLRVPVEFLFPGLYDGLKLNIRREEELHHSAGHVGTRSHN